MSASRPRGDTATSVVFVGAGPRTVGLLERFSASLDELVDSDRDVEVHLVDPYPAGGGRIWRRRQSPLLWMNSVARDVTLFTDASVTCDGPIRPGPALDEWLDGDGIDILRSSGLGHYVGRFSADSFIPREVQSLYLQWGLQRTMKELPSRVRVEQHATRATWLSDSAGGRQVVRLANGEVLFADVVVLAAGYLDRALDADHRALADEASAAGLTYVPPGYTADLDLSGVPAGADVVVRGFGLAFIDLMALLCEGRGGTFRENSDGSLSYQRSGAEPVLHVGSRRGVPYHAKLGYAIANAIPRVPRYLTRDFIDDHPATTIDFETELWPLAIKELTAAHYERLCTAHPERVTTDWRAVQEVLDRSDIGEFGRFIASVVPSPEDRFDIDRINRPFAADQWPNAGGAEAAVRDYIERDLSRRADPAYSADRAVFDALLGVYVVLSYASSSGRITATDRVERFERGFHSLFSFLASGPPPQRLRELLALHDAGVVRFGGPEWDVEVRDGEFVATSAAHSGETAARVLIDAWLPKPDVKATTDPLIRGLLSDGELAVEDLPDGLPGGQLLADSGSRAIRADRSVHERRFLLGPSVSGSAGASGFARPNFNAPGPRQNDAVAREVLRLVNAQIPALMVTPEARAAS